jgi:hypothetical protein
MLPHEIFDLVLDVVVIGIYNICTVDNLTHLVTGISIGAAMAGVVCGGTFWLSKKFGRKFDILALNIFCLMVFALGIYCFFHPNPPPDDYPGKVAGIMIIVLSVLIEIMFRVGWWWEDRGLTWEKVGDHFFGALRRKWRAARTGNASRDLVAVLENDLKGR